MSANILTNPLFRAFDASGNPLAGGKLYTYKAGTTTPKATYTDATLTTPHTNPIILDAEGSAVIWLEGAYKLDLYSATDVQQNDYPIDNVSSFVQDYNLYTTTGSANSYILTTGSSLSFLEDGFFVDVKFNVANTGASTINIDGLGIKQILKQGNLNLVSGDLDTVKIYRLIYDGTNFQIQSSSLPNTLSFTTIQSTNVIAQNVQATGSAGVDIKNNSGTSVLLLGAGGGTGATLAGQLNTGGSIVQNNSTSITNTRQRLSSIGGVFASDVYSAWNTSSVFVNYGGFGVNLTNGTAGSHAGQAEIYAAISGSYTTVMTFGATITANRVISAVAGLIGLSTANQSYSNGVAGSVAHGLGRRPFMVQAVAVCITGEGDYSANDEVLLASLGTGSSSPSVFYGFSIYTDDTTNIKWRASSDGIMATRKTSAQNFVLTPANWRIKFNYL